MNFSSNVANSLRLTVDFNYTGSQRNYDKAMAEIYSAGGRQASGYKLEFTK